jgi:alkanesulfonate monooxygenase SsuD/methylene tetrahydromethanopterin reductase-like flavin-dependent oxidoreductase (luciferase family)
MDRAPLSVLDLVPVASGADAATALRHTIDLARRAEALGYRRYWLAEHHLNPGVAGTSPPIIAALIAGATERLRVGSGGMQMGHRTALSVVEEFGLLDAAFPGRIDLGLGRSGGRPRRPAASNGNGAVRTPAPPPVPVAVGADGSDGGGSPAPPPARIVDGLLLPPPFSYESLRRLPRAALHRELLQQPDAVTPAYADVVHTIVELLAGSYRAANGAPAHIVPGEHADLEVWILGSSAGESASVAGTHGLAFAANYHVQPGNVLDAVDAYRAAFVPSPARDRPRVSVSADVLVADTDAAAARLAAGYAPWVRSIRTGAGAIAFPSPEEADRVQWTEAERAVVADRLATQLVGSPATVVERLETLQRVTGADELLVTTMTHDHADRVRSYELLAEAWAAR